MSFDSYVANGRQYPQLLDAGMGDASQPTKPTVKRTAMTIVGSGAPSGGTLSLRHAINYSTSQEGAWTMTEPGVSSRGVRSVTDCEPDGLTGLETSDG